MGLRVAKAVFAVRAGQRRIVHHVDVFHDQGRRGPVVELDTLRQQVLFAARGIPDHIADDVVPQ